MLNLEVGADMTAGDLKAVIESDTGIAANQQVLFFNGKPIRDASTTLEAAGIREGEMIAMRIREAPPNRPRQQPARQDPRDDAEIVRLQALGNPDTMNQIRRYKHELAEAAHDPRAFREIWDGLKRKEEERDAERARLDARLNADPFDIDAQLQIEERIRQEAVMENLRETMENTPEGKNVGECGTGNTQLMDTIGQRSGGCTCCTSTSKSTRSR